MAWTQLGPVAVEDLPAAQLRARAAGTPLLVHSLDKFPRMLDYVVPTGVRVADADRVRLGAHLAEGTTVMHEGFVNFNAGTLGTAMVEGRISQGVVMGEGSDLGGGASIMGTLSGGGKVVVRIGERCLVGANAGIGISLGDDCVVEAGLYVTAGTRVTLPDGTVVKAQELSGQGGLLFLRNSTTGTVEALRRSGPGTVELNPTSTPPRRGAAATAYPTQRRSGGRSPGRCGRRVAPRPPARARRRAGRRTRPGDTRAPPCSASRRARAQASPSGAGAQR